MADENDDRDTGRLQLATELLPAVYAELRRMAAELSGRLRPGQTLQPTALVHEAYLKLVRDHDPGWQGRRHFFGAAAQAMREILIDQARRKASQKHGGQANRIELAEGVAWIEPPADDLLALDEALGRLEQRDPVKARLVTLRYFAGMTTAQAAAALNISRVTAHRYWTFARAWLHQQMTGAPPE